jgi:hypothetical protein
MSKRFSDFATSDLIDGSKVKIAEVLDKEIEVIDFKIDNSKLKPNEKCLKLQFMLGSEKHIIFTGSNVLMDQCVKYKAEMPFVTVIKMVNKHYTFS